MRTTDDLVDLFDGVWQRLDARMADLTDAEWAWCPTSDDRIGLRWRLAHITDVLSDCRNWQWLGAPPDRPPANADATSAITAVAALAAAYTAWRALLAGPDIDLSEPIGAAAGRYGDATRRSFVLHIANELIHHAAECELLRDLYAARAAAAPPAG